MSSPFHWLSDDVLDGIAPLDRSEEDEELTAIENAEREIEKEENERIKNVYQLKLSI